MDFTMFFAGMVGGVLLAIVAFILMVEYACAMEGEGE